MDAKDSHPKLKEAGLFLLDILYNAAIIIILVVLIRSFLISPFRVVGSSMADTLHNKEFILIDKLSYLIGEVERGDPIVFLPPIASKDNPKFENNVRTNESGVARIELAELRGQKSTPYCAHKPANYLWFCIQKAETGDGLFYAPQDRQAGSMTYQTEWNQVKRVELSPQNLEDGYIEIKGEPDTNYAFRIYDSKGDEYYVKRVIGIPGDTVKVEGGKVYLKRVGEDSFELIKEAFLNKTNKEHTYLNPLRDNDSYVVPEGHYFVLGDNRTHSSDSRGWVEPITQKESPFVPEGNISGKVFVVLWPFTDIRLIPSADFFN